MRSVSKRMSLGDFNLLVNGRCGAQSPALPNSHIRRPPAALNRSTSTSHFGRLARWILGRSGGGNGILGGVVGFGSTGTFDEKSPSCRAFSESQFSPRVTISPILVSGNFISPILKSLSDLRASTVCPADFA